MGLFDACGISVQWRAALKVSGYLQFDEVEGCDTHDGEKIGRSSIGELAKTKNKQVINPFPERAKLIENFQGTGKTLISNHANLIVHENMLIKKYIYAKTVAKRDLNKTRISARQSLLRAALRVKRGLDLCESTHENSNFTTKEE